jgi:hypothetical protein
LPAFVQAGLYSTNGSDLYVTAQVFVGGRPLMLPAQTAYRSKATRWNEWLTLPIKYRDLPRASVIVFTVWDISARAPQSNCIYLMVEQPFLCFFLPPCEFSAAFAFRSCQPKTVCKQLRNLHVDVEFLIWACFSLQAPRERVPVGGSTMSIFGSDGCVREGTFTLKLWEGVEGDGKGSGTEGIQPTEISRLQAIARR